MEDKNKDSLFNILFNNFDDDKKEEVKKGNYDPWNFEEEELEDDDYYFDDDKDEK